MKSFILIYYQEVADAIRDGVNAETIMKMHTDQEKQKAREFSRMLRAEGLTL